MTTDATFEKISEPPRTLNSSGHTRRVGVEIEISGLTVGDVATCVHELFGGEYRVVDAHRHLIEDSRYGRFVVELDAQLVHAAAGAGERPANGDLTEAVDEKAREILGYVVSGFVPVEIVAPPIPWPRLTDLNPVFDRLRDLGAEGTKDHPLNSFGLHLNPEVASEDVDFILPCFRAFLILSDWLREVVDVDMTRRLLPHIDRFPGDYVRKVVDPGYAPDQGRLIDDYIAANPTRNRELDLLPLFRHLDEERVVRRLDAGLVKARPTFHYRLPNCDLSVPSWNAVVEWNRWVMVERLAADPDRLCCAAEDFLRDRARPPPTRWLEDLLEWLEE